MTTSLVLSIHTDLCTYLFLRVYLSIGGAYNLQLICAILRKFSNPVKKLLQDLPRKDPFFLHSCKILAISPRSRKILQDLAGMQQKGSFLGISCKNVFTGKTKLQHT